MADGLAYSNTVVVSLYIIVFSSIVNLSVCTLSHKLVMTASLNLKTPVFLINEAAIPTIRIAANFLLLATVPVVKSLLRCVRWYYIWSSPV